MSMRVRKLLIRVLLVVALLAIVFALSVRGLLVSDPGWYRHIEIDPNAQALGQRQVQDQIAQLSNSVSAAHLQTRPADAQWPTFDVEFTETQLNGMISRWEGWGPFEKVLKEVSEPHLRFLEDRVVAAGRLRSNGMLVSIELSVEPSPDGPKVTLGRPWAGRMPLARSLVTGYNDEIDAKLHDPPVPKQTIDSLKALLAGDTIAPIVTVPNNVVGERELLPAKVEKLEIKDGVLRATLRPIAGK